MNSKHLNTKIFALGKTYMGRLPHGQDLITSIESFCNASDITTGVLSVIGALSSATIGIYDQQQQVYITEKIEKELEIITCTGNISLKEGKPFCHAHFILSDADGRTYGGHVMSESILFAGELHLQELVGDNLERIYDQTTGLMLWDLS